MAVKSQLKYARQQIWDSSVALCVPPVLRHGKYVTALLATLSELMLEHATEALLHLRWRKQVLPKRYCPSTKIYVPKSLCTLKMILSAFRTSYVKGTFEDAGMADMIGT
jgi:hypothetical protein